MNNNSFEQPRNAEQGREPEETINVAGVIGEGRGSLPGHVPDEISDALSKVDRLPEEQLIGMLARRLPAEELRDMAEGCMLAGGDNRQKQEVLRSSVLYLADEDTRKELRDVVYEQRTEVLRSIYQEAHGRRRLPGRVFRIPGYTEEYDEYVVASLAGRTGETRGSSVYFYDGRFWYEDGDSPELLDTQARFLPDAATTNAVVSAYSANLADGWAPVECLPGTYPVYYTLEEEPTTAHKYYEPEPIADERVLRGDSLETAAAEFIDQERHTASGHYLSLAWMYDETRWVHIFSESRFEFRQRQQEKDRRITEAGRQLRKRPGS